MREFYKYSLIILAFIYSAFNTSASDFYWVGGNGRWDNSLNWSNESGGVGGIGIPSALDNVIVDKNSFSSENQAITLTGSQQCKNFIWNQTSKNPILKGKSRVNLDVHGNFSINETFQNEYLGSISFLSNNPVEIKSDIILNSDIIINSTNDIILQSNITTTKKIELIGGNLNTNNFKVTALELITTGNNSKSLSLSNSDIKIEKLWDTRDTTNFKFDAGNSTIIFTGNYPKNFKTNGLEYNRLVTSEASKSTVIDISVTPIRCVGKVTVDITSGGTPNYKYVLHRSDYSIIEESAFTPNRTYTFNDSVTHLIYYVSVYDGSSYSGGLIETKRLEPSGSLPLPLTAVVSVEKDASCYAGLDFELRVDGTGGVEPYTYLWTSNPASALGLPADQQIHTNFLAEGVFTGQITDALGCKKSDGIRYHHFAPDYSGPADIAINTGTTTSTPSCGNTATGTIQINATGGTGVLSYSIESGGNGTYQASGLFENVLPGEYEVWVEDENGCKKQGSNITVSSVIPPSSDAGNGGSICPGQTFTLSDATASNFTSLLWEIEGAGNGTFNDNTRLDATYTPGTTDIANGIVQLKLSVFGDTPCDASTDYVTINIHSLPTGNISGGETICEGETAPVGFSFTGTAPWTFSFSNGTDVINQTTSDNPFNTSIGIAGTYTISSLSDANCIASSAGMSGSATVIVNLPPTANAGDDVSICSNETYNFPSASVSNNSSINWSIQTPGSDGFFDYNDIINPVFTPGNADITRGFVVIRLTAIGNAPCPIATSDITITFTQIPTASISGDATICSGSSTPIQIDFANTPAPWSYQYTDGTTPVSGTTSSNPYIFNVSTAGVYSLVSVSNSTCTGTVSGSATVEVNQAPTANAGGNASICSGANYTLSSASATNAVSYSWTKITPGADGTFNNNSSLNPQYTPGPNDIANGSVILQLEVIGQAPCPSAISQMTLTINPRPSVIVSGDATICEGDATNISFDLTGSSPWQITYSNGTTTQNISTSVNPYLLSVNQAGVYTATAISDNNCTGTSLNGSATIVVNPAPLSFAGNNSQICAGENNNLADATASQYSSLLWTTSGDGTFSNTSILNPTYTPGANDVSNGSVQLTLTANGLVACPPAVSNKTLTINAIPTAEITGGGTVCAGTSTEVSILLTGIAPWNIAYTDGTNNFNVTANSSPYIINATENGTYSLISVNDANCNGNIIPGSVLVIVTQPPTAFAGNDSYLCATQSHTLSEATASNYASLLWNKNSGDGTFNNINILNPTYTPGVNDITNGTITLTLTAYGNIPCPNAVSEITLDVNELPTGTVSGGGAICIGEESQIQFDLTGNAPWEMEYTDGTNNFNATINSNPYTINTSTEGTYSINSLSDAFCTGNFFVGSADVSVTPAPTVAVSGGTTLCEGETTNIQFDFTGVAPWEFVYTDGTTNNTIVTSDNPYLLNTGSQGDYSVISLKDAACSGTDISGNAIVTVQSAPIINLENSEPICFGNDYTITGTTVLNASSYTWTTLGDGTFDNASSLNPTYTPGDMDLLNQTVTLRLTAQGIAPCTQVFEELILNYAPELKVSIGSPSPFLISASTDIRVCITGEHDQVQDLGFYLNSPTGQVFELAPSPYEVGVCNFGTDFDSLCFTTNASEVLNMCVPGPWPSPALRGDYLPTDSWTNLYGIDPSQGGWEIEIRDYFAAYSGKLTKAFIFFTDINHSGQIETVSYFSPSNTEITIPNPTVIGAYGYAKYTVPMGLRVSCHGACDALAIVNPFGGTPPYMTYEWNDPSLPSNPIAQLCAGSYTVTVTDAMGCKASSSVDVTEPEPIVTNITVTNIECKDESTGSIQITAQNGLAPYTYNWSNGSTTQNLNNIPAGRYFVTVTDSKGCQMIDTADVIEPTNAISLLFNIDSTSCYSSSDGSIEVIPSGGTIPSGNYTYLWSTGNTTNVISDLTSGKYYITVSDDNLCEKVDSISVYSPEELIVNLEQSLNPDCFGDETGNIVVSASGGVGPYSYIWNDSDNTIGATLSNVGAGNYQVSVYDSKGCMATLSTNLTEPDEMIALIGSPAPFLISESTRVKVIFSGKHNQVQDLGFYLIAPNGTTMMELAPSPYEIGVCNFGLDFEDLSFSTEATNILNMCTPFPWPTPALTGDYMPTDSWNTLYGFNPARGGWTVEIRDYFGAYDGELNNVVLIFEDIDEHGDLITLRHESEEGLSVPILSPNQGTYKAAHYTIPISLSVSCNGFCDAKALVSVLGGTSPYTNYEWSDPLLPNSNRVSLCGGDHSVTVTDSKGCQSVAHTNVYEPDPILTWFDTTNISCFGDATGGAIVNANNGTEPYNYEWSNGSTIQEISNVIAGKYLVTVTDAKNCPQYDTVKIIQPEIISINATVYNTSCYGIADGKIEYNVSGGVAPYQYYWTYVEGIDTLNINTPDLEIIDLKSNTYSLKIIDANMCEFDTLFIVETPDSLIANIYDYSNASCGGYTDAYAIVDVVGGTEPYSYNWNGLSITDTLENIGTGSYTVTVTDANGCLDSSTVFISEPDPVIINFTDTLHLSCMGINTGSAKAQVTGGNIPYTYLWEHDANQTDSIALNLPYGWTQLSITDNLGCIATDSIFINSPDSIIISFTIESNLNCHGDSNAIAKAVAVGGIGEYNYTWSSGSTDSIAENLSSKYHYLSVTDENGCEVVDSIYIPEPEKMIIVSTGYEPTTCTGNIGKAFLELSGGTQPYSYLWENGETSDTLFNLYVGVYSVTVSDINNCIVDTLISVNDTSSLDIYISATKPSISCFGVADGEARVHVSGGSAPYTYLWSNGQTTFNASGLEQGEHFITVTDRNLCSKVALTTISSEDALTASFSVNNISCNGDADGIISANVSKGLSPYLYNWSNGMMTSSIYNLEAGEYSVSIVDQNGCQILDTFNILEPNILEASIIESSNLICAGSRSGSAKVRITNNTGTAPYNYLWSNGEQDSIANSLSEGWNFVTITDASSCFTIDSVFLTAPSNNISLSFESTPATCEASDATLKVIPSGGIEPYSILWSNGSTDSLLSNISVNIYDVTVTDSLGCIMSSYYIVNDTSSLIITDIIKTNIYCTDCIGEMSVVVDGGTPDYSYLWSNSDTTSSIDSLCANGIFTLTVTDINGCSQVIRDTIIQKDNLEIEFTDIVNLSCHGDNDASVSVNLVSGVEPYSYLWSNGETENTATNLSSGWIYVTVSDANCTVIDSIEMKEPVMAELEMIVRNVNCNGDSEGIITADITNEVIPISYLWSDGQTESSAINLSNGDYSVTVYYGDGCFVEGASQIVEPSLITYSLTTETASCGNNDASISLISNSDYLPHSYLWSIYGNQDSVLNGNNNATLSNIGVDYYIAKIIDSKGCELTTEPIRIIDNGDLTVNLENISHVSCFGRNDGRIEIAPQSTSAPYNYEWWMVDSNQLITDTLSTPLTGIAYNLYAGEYKAYVRNADTCTSVELFNITNNLVLSGIFDSIQNVSCNGLNDGLARILAQNGTPKIIGDSYDYEWSSGNNSSIAENLFAGLYYVTISDSTGCEYIDSVQITEPNLLEVSFGLDSIATVCYSDILDSLSFTITNGIAPFTYLWSNGATDSVAYNLPIGMNYITVTDITGCNAATDSILIYKQGDYRISFDTTSTLCADSIGTAKAIVIGGQAPYSYLWSTGDITDSISSLWVDYYSITVTDSDGCTVADTIAINDESTIIFDIAALKHIRCEGTATGSAMISNIDGGTNPYSIWWSSSETIDTAFSLIAGFNTVKVIDSIGCVGLGSVNINNDSVLRIINFAYTDDNSCDGYPNASARVNVAGGDRPYSYQWNTNITDTLDRINHIGEGRYFVTVYDANGCATIDSIDIVKDPIRIEILATKNVDCFGYNSGEISLRGRGGMWAGYNYQWSNGATTASIDSLLAGDYIITVSENLSNCIAIDTITITQPADFTRNFVTTQQTGCNDSTGVLQLSITGGTRPFDYQWSNGSTDSVISNVWADYFFVTITDANGCEIIDSALVEDNSPFTVASANIRQVKCHNLPSGMLTVVPSNGVYPYTYNWNHDEALVDSIAGGLLGGIYTVTVTDSESCKRVLNFPRLIEPDSIQLSIVVVDSIKCNGLTGKIVANVIGGNEVNQYVWKKDSITYTRTDDTLFNAYAGTYSLYVNDSEGCFSDTVQITLDQPNPIIVTADIIPTGCEDLRETGQIRVTNITGDFAPFKYIWYNSPDTLVYGVASADSLERINLNNEQSYTFKVTDSTGCKITEYFTVTPEYVIGFDSNINPTNCNYYTEDDIINNNPDGNIEITNIVGGVAPYEFNWELHNTYYINGNSQIKRFGTAWEDGMTEAVNLQADSIAIEIKSANKCVSKFMIHIWAEKYLNTKIYATDGVNRYPVSKRICLNDSILLASQSLDTLFNGDTIKDGNELFTWKVPSGYNNSTINTPNSSETYVLPDSTTIYSLIRSNEGCTAPPINNVTISHYTESLNAGIVHNGSFYGKEDAFELIGGEEIEILPFDDNTTTYYQDTLDNIWPVNAFSSFVWNSYNEDMSRKGKEGHIVDTTLNSTTYIETGLVGFLHQPMNPIIYTVQGITNNGCIDYDTISVHVIPDIFIPSAFSPNGDGINDIWEIPYLRLCPNAEIIIFNRWGVKLWEKDKNYHEEPWDGKNSNGKELKLGTYYYIINFNDEKGTPSKAGSITIVR